MKNRIVNVLSTVIIIISSVLIIRYFIVSANNKNDSQQDYYEDEEYVLTECESPNSEIYLGEVEIGSTISQKYVLKNKGEHPLVLRAISPDCHCTDFKVSQYTAAPQDSIVVTLFVDTKGKSEGNTVLNTVVQVNTEEEYYLLTLKCELVSA